MKTCPNCRNQINDDSVYCPVCGTGVGTVPQFTQPQTSAPVTDYSTNYGQPPIYTAPAAYVDPYDHTAEFDAADIADTKVFAMAMYLLGPLGIIITLLSVKESRYAAFHVRQAMKLTVAEVLGVLALAVIAFLMWNLRMRGLMFLLVAVALIGLVLIHLLCVLSICKGMAKEVYLVRSLRFLK